MMDERDFVAEMNTFIDEVIGDQPFVAPTVAEKVVAKLRETDPGLLAGWLDLGAAQFVREAITARDRATRRRARRSAVGLAFAAAADALEQGESEPITQFLTMPFTVEGGLRKPLADMDAADLRYAAADFEQRETENRMTKAFLRAIQKKVTRRKTVGDVFDEATLAAMWRSITGGAAA